MIGTVARLSRKLLATDPERRGLLFEAFVLVALARILLFTFSMRRARPVLALAARRVRPRAADPSAKEVVWALSAVTKRFAGTCLANALAAQALLKKYGYSSR